MFFCYMHGFYYGDEVPNTKFSIRGLIQFEINFQLIGLLRLIQKSILTVE